MFYTSSDARERLLHITFDILNTDRMDWQEVRACILAVLDINGVVPKQVEGDDCDWEHGFDSRINNLSTSKDFKRFTLYMMMLFDFSKPNLK